MTNGNAKLNLQLGDPLAVRYKFSCLSITSDLKISEHLAAPRGLVATRHTMELVVTSRSTII